MWGIFMFSKALSTVLLREMNKRDITQEELAEICSLSKRFMGDIVRGHAVPRLDSFEKICAGLEVSPEDLLVDKKSRYTNKLTAMQVTHIKCIQQVNTKEYFPICPSCQITLERDYQAYCDRCGQKLSWKNYSKAKIIE